MHEQTKKYEDCRDQEPLVFTECWLPVSTSALSSSNLSFWLSFCHRFVILLCPVHVSQSSFLPICSYALVMPSTFLVKKFNSALWSRRRQHSCSCVLFSWLFPALFTPKSKQCYCLPRFSCPRILAISGD